MATAPCSIHKSPQPGRLCGFYPALVLSGQRASRKFQVCQPCSREVIGRHAKDWQDFSLYGSQEGPPACTSCGLVADVGVDYGRFYCTVYLDGKNRRDYRALYCPDCSRKCLEEFEIDG